MLVFVVVGVLAAAAPVTLVLTVPAVIAGFVWLMVKLSFLVVAAIATRHRPFQLLRTSAAVSAGRFWPVLGRLLLLWLVVAAIGLVLGFVPGLIDGGTQASGYEVEVVAEGDIDAIRFTSDGVTGAFVVASVLAAVLTAFQSAITAAGLTSIYRDAGMPVDAGPQ